MIRWVDSTPQKWGHSILAFFKIVLDDDAADACEKYIGCPIDSKCEVWSCTRHVI